MELDHTQPRAQEGPHSAENLEPLCRFHHMLKTYEGWTLVGSHEDGWQLLPPDHDDVRAPPASNGPDPPDQLALAGSRTAREPVRRASR